MLEDTMMKSTEQSSTETLWKVFCEAGLRVVLKLVHTTSED